MNRPPHHEKIHQLALDFVNNEDLDIEPHIYNQIKDVCETHEDTILDHPFQWETLADFTLENDHNALKIYFKALKLATKANLTEYVASINLAIAERYMELEDFNKAWSFANSANQAAESSNDLALKQEISEILLESAEYT
jgi:SAM-dependent MidA family methyltransferase